MSPTGIAGAIRRGCAWALVALLWTACSGGDGSPSGAVPRAARTGSAAAPPVVLVSVDTLRADRLAAYGYDRGRTPAIDALVADAVLFENAFAHAPLTLPSHASMLTGLLPTQHGARDNAEYRVDGSVATMAELLRAAGYRTAAAVSAFPLRAEAGLDRGFDLYDDELPPATGRGIGAVWRPGDETVDAALRWLARDDSAAPFLWIHLFEPHAPYQPPADVGVEDPYDGEIVVVDRLVARIVAELRRLGMYEEALVLFVADHGEGLGDHGEQEHGLLLYREALHVPLILKLPAGRRAGERVQSPAQLVDLLPTVLDVTGVDAAPAGVGTSLLAAGFESSGARPIYAEALAPRLYFGWSELASLIVFPHQYIEAPRAELYDLANDPMQRDDRIAEMPAVASRMRMQLEAMTVPAEPAARIDPVARERLASLGYLNVSGGSAAPAETRPVDPKDVIHLADRVREGTDAYYAGDYDRAIAVLTPVIEESRGVNAAWLYLGLSQRAAGRTAEAIAAFERLQERSPSSETALALAELYLVSGRLGEARAAANAARLEHPHDAAMVRVEAELAERRFDRAEQEARALLRGHPGSGRARLALARALMHQQRLAEALAAVDALAAQADALPAGARELRGRVLVLLGRHAEARVEFEAEVAADPGRLQAWEYLAELGHLAGDPTAAVKVLERMAQAVPGPEAEVARVRALERWGMTSLAETHRREAVRRYPQLAGLFGA